MAGDAVAEVKARLDLVEVIGGYVTLHRAGRELSGLCPFHAEKTPSFTVSPERQVWYCHGCHEGGDLFKFIEQIERIDFRQALELLADRAGVELESGPHAGRGAGRKRRRSIELNTKAQAYYQHVLWSSPAGAPGRALLEERAVDEVMARKFGIGFAPAGGPGEDALARYLTGKGGADIEELADAGLAHPPQRGRTRDRFRDRLVFPIRDDRGEVLGFGGRALGDAKPKYLNSPDSSAYHKSVAIFGIDLARGAIAKDKTALIVEGYFDVIAAHAAGIESTVASSGTALTREQVHSLGRIAETLILCFDGDDAGRAATTRAVDVIAAEGLQARICRLPLGAKDPDELVRRDPAAFLQAITEAPPAWQVLLDAALAVGEGGSVDARRAAAERAVSVLARIPEATTRELYLQQAARRLDIGARSLTTDLLHAVRDGTRRPARIVVAAPAEASAGVPDDTTEPPDADEPMPAWEAQLARVLPSSRTSPPGSAVMAVSRRTSSRIQPPGGSSMPQAPTHPGSPSGSSIDGTNLARPDCWCVRCPSSRTRPIPTH
jgi:DNA primase